MSECKTCQGTGEILEYCCNGQDCACRGEGQFQEDCPDCDGNGEVK